jgi:2-dehydro-3-deoxyphosphogluconate aldolase / (4S)-4-hydroxy-2-oxoglutarate aldolase
MAMNIRDIVGLARVIPEIILTDISQALPLARALSAGGLRVLEVSLRSAAAAGCIEAIRKGAPELIVGAGSLTRAVDFAAADRAGAQFGVTPGLTAEIAAACRGARFPVMPGVMTPSEVISARNLSFATLQLFPAEQCGGVHALQSFGAIFPDVVFCVSGGVTLVNAADYLALSNVASVGGSWMVPQRLLEAADWAGIEALAREAAAVAMGSANKRQQ